MMKHKSIDMKEILTTGEDRVAKVNELKDFFSHLPAIKFSVTRRKLASGEKFYFHADAVGDQYKNNPDLMWKRPLRDFVLNQVKSKFPNASVSSGGTLSLTIVEY